MNTALETFAYTKAILVKPWPAAYNNSITNDKRQVDLYRIILTLHPSSQPS